MNAPLLTVTSVSKSFGDVVALDDVSVEIQQNEFFALLGPSGCGKTTLLRSIAGFDDPDSGFISIVTDRGAQDLLALPPNRRPVNLMFQSYALFPHMTVWKNIAYGLEREHLSKQDVQARVTEVVETVGLTDKVQVRPNQLSGGQRQRVALARAIVKRPRLLLLDEPLSALDRKVRAEMQLELKRLQHDVGITFVVVTHDQEEAMSMADRIAVMHEGRVQQIADPVTLYGDPANVFVADFIGRGTMFRGTARPNGLEMGSTVFPGRNPNGITGSAVLLLRPEDLRLQSAGTTTLTGTVVETHFFGGASTTTISLPEHDQLITASHPGAPTMHPGALVGIDWDPQKAVVIASAP
jgi:ABC-type Fe3+/spermidine/putrescine transport system ATPase subunit